MFLARAIRSAPDKPWARALRETLAAALQDAEQAAPLHKAPGPDATRP